MIYNPMDQLLTPIFSMNIGEIKRFEDKDMDIIFDIKRKEGVNFSLYVYQMNNTTDSYHSKNMNDIIDILLKKVRVNPNFIKVITKEENYV